MAPAQPPVWNPPAVPDPASFNDLADLLLHYRRWRMSEIWARPWGGPFSDISDDGLRELIKLAGYAGLHTDEGRYARLKLTVLSSDAQTSPIVRFDPLIPIKNPEDLSRLAPTVTSNMYALEIRESGGALECVGVHSLRAPEPSSSWSMMLDDVERPREYARGLTVWLSSPGEIRVAGGEGSQEVAFAYRAGKVFWEEPFSREPNVNLWLKELFESIRSSCKAADPEFRNIAAQAFAPRADILWSQILSVAREQGHGGAFVILKDPKTAPIEIKHKTFLGPGDQGGVGSLRSESTPTLRGLIESVSRAGGEYWKLVRKHDFGVADKSRYVEEGIEFKRKLTDLARAVGGLSATDGCVVFDRDLNLRGFGGIIGENPAGSANLTYSQRPGAPPDKRSLLEKRGTRHKSAYQLCEQCPETLAFVVSQDGNLRIFSSDHQHVYFWERQRLN